MPLALSNFLTTPNFVNFQDKEKWVKNIHGIYTKEKLPNTLVAWVVEEDHSLSETLGSAAELTDTLMQYLRKAFSKTGWQITNPVAVVATKWYADTNFRGSYSYRGAEAHRKGVTNADLREPLANSAGKKVVFFAGEATHDIHYATLHGAVESGFVAADDIFKLKN